MSATTGLRRLLRPLAIALVLGLGAFAIAVLTGLSDFVQRVESASYDWRVRETAVPATATSPVVIVDIDESSIRALEPMIGKWTWPRSVYAAAIDYIASGGARVIAVDLLLGEREGRSQMVINGETVTGDVSDRALAEAARSAGNVIFLAEATFEGLARSSAASHEPPLLPGTIYAPGPGFERRPTLQLPFDDLRLVARGIGHNYQVRDAGSDFARRVRPFVDVGGIAVPSLGMAAALAFLDVPIDQVQVDAAGLRVGDRRMPLTADPARDTAGITHASRQALLRFARPVTENGVTSTFTSYSFFDVLLSSDQAATGKPPAVPPSAFAGKIVFIGASAAGTFDRYQTPFRSGASGVELHATLADNLIAGRFMERASAAWDLSVTGAVALASSLLSVLLPVVWATAGVAAVVLAVGWWLMQAVGDGRWMAMVAPAMAASTALFGGVAWQYFVEGRQKREIRRLFGRFVSNDVIEQLTTHPELAGLGGQRREMSVLFSDIRGFTSVSEQGDPEALVAQLNEYFGAMVEVLFRHHGTLDKFVGDMVMGLFGAPVADPRHADHAVAAAIEMVDTLDRLNRQWEREGRSRLDIGIGINSGEMIAGNIGAETIMSYTVIGDAVNLGARLESLNKEYGTRILISEATKRRLTGSFQTREIGAVTVKGRTQAVVVHEVVGGRAADFAPGQSS